MSDSHSQSYARLHALREMGVNPFPNHFRPTHSLGEIHASFGELEGEALTARQGEELRVAGRIRFWNAFGKSTFLRIHDRSQPLQIYVRTNELGSEAYSFFKDEMAVGDIIGVTGHMMRTRTGELTLLAHKVELLTKTVRQLPEKYHGLADLEARQRMRYVDLMVNEETREVFRRRTRTLKAVRAFFDARDFLEVETPMLHPLAGGAAARPFTTHHNALDMQLFLRIAPELYLKRLVVGGFERVYEINRNFRNEGLSARHNPEFTMLEFYLAFARCDDLLDLTEALLPEVAMAVCGTTELVYNGQPLSFKPPFRRLPLRRSLVEIGGLTEAQIQDEDFLRQLLRSRNIPLRGGEVLGQLQAYTFEAVVEDQLWQPTFITEYPVEVSPLARRSDADPSVTERFELFCGGLELANGFSELNDPEDQRQRFLEQVKARESGDDEATPYDADYVRALEYGMPPTAGQGLGIDRLVMMLTGQTSIREVILFPLLRPESGGEG